MKAEQLELNYYSIFSGDLQSKIFFGGDIIGFVDLIKTFKASFLPMGYFSTRNLDIFQFSISILWISLVLLISILNFINRKRVF